VLDRARATGAMQVRAPAIGVCLITEALDRDEPALFGPFVRDPSATARIFVIARPNFRRRL
jgi:hypothetical protein